MRDDTSTPITEEGLSWPFGDGEMASRIRRFDWGTTALGPADRWPQSLKSAVDMILGMPSPAIILWGAQNVQIYNDAFVAIASARHPKLLGQPAVSGWADVYEEILAPLSAAKAAQATRLRDYVGKVDGPDGPEERVFDADWSPLRDESGEVAGVLQTLVETTQRHRAEAALRDSEEQYRTLFETMEQGFCVIERLEAPDGGLVDFRYITANPAFERHTGMRDVIGRTIRELVPGAEQATMDIYDDVARNGRRRHLEAYVSDLDRWIDLEAVPAQGPGQVAVLFSDITMRKRAEIAVRESGERQAFLLKLSDKLRPLADPVEIMAAASEALGRHLKAGRCGYWEVDEIGEYFIVERDWTDGVMPSLVGKHPLVGFGPEFVEAYRAGRSVLIEDALADARAAGSEAAFEAAGGVRASLGLPLVKAGRLVAGLFVQQLEPRHWTAQDEALSEDVAERTWAAVERARAEAAKRASQDRLQRVLETDAVGVLFFRDDGTLISGNEVFGRMTGYSQEELRSGALHWRDFTPPEWVADREAQMTGFARTGRVGPYEKEFLSKDGSRSWMLFAGRGLGDGTIVEFAIDISERKAAEAALCESEEQFREFGEASSDVLWIRDAETLRWEYLSKGFEAVYGMSRDEALSGNTLRNWAELILPEDREHALDCIRKVGEGQRATFEYRIRRPSDGEIRWLRDTDFPMRDGGDQVLRIGGVGQDITALKRAEDHQRMLLAELQHRVRNTLSIVRSIASRTAENSTDVEEMLAHFQGRLDAFSRVQAALTRSPNATVDLGSLIEDELIAHAARDGGQVAIKGPRIRLEPKTAERLSLAFHELATNAVKHGALCSDEGRIRIRWKTQPNGSGDELLLDWKESGVELQNGEMRREGFGMELLLRSLPYDLQAKTRVELASTGLQFELQMPLSRNGATGGA